MFASRLSALRPSLRAAYGFQWTQTVGRRGYATIQERVGMGSDRPWQMAAVGVTVPGLLWLRKGETSMSQISHPNQIKRQVKATAQSVPKVMAESMPKGDKVAAVMENPPSTNPQRTTNNPADTAAILSPASKPTEVDASIENQIEKLADKLPSQPVNPNGA